MEKSSIAERNVKKKHCKFLYKTGFLSPRNNASSYMCARRARTHITTRIIPGTIEELAASSRQTLLCGQASGT